MLVKIVVSCTSLPSCFKLVQVMDKMAGYCVSGYKHSGSMKYEDYFG